PMLDDSGVERRAVHAVFGELVVRVLGRVLAAEATAGADQFVGADRIVQRQHRVAVTGKSERGGEHAHGAHSASASNKSMAWPSGLAATPCESRNRACWMVCSGTPNCSARLQTTAESRAAASASEPILPLVVKKISAIRLSLYRDTEATNPIP